MEYEPTNKGVKTRLLGIILIVLGVLDSMLSWRGGFAVSELYVFFIGAGILLYIVGAIRRSSHGP